MAALVVHVVFVDVVLPHLPSCLLRHVLGASSERMYKDYLFVHGGTVPSLAATKPAKEEAAHARDLQCLRRHNKLVYVRSVFISQVSCGAQQTML